MERGIFFKRTNLFVLDWTRLCVYNVNTYKQRGVFLAAVVKTSIVKIGNSQGIRIPKLLIRQLQLTGEVELTVKHNQLMIKPSQRPRQGWDEQFRQMAERQDDRLLDEDAVSLTQWDQDEWQWK
jgi:antitoxin MazE